LHHAIARDVFKGASPKAVLYNGNKEVGKYVRERVFVPGRTLDWDALTEHVTGERLNARAFADDFKN
jgi:peptidyl-dipeptidase A